MGVIAIRVLAGGALSGAIARHPVAAPEVDAIATSQEYADDVLKAAAFQFLVTDGYVSSLVEAAIRFAISNPHVSTALVGYSSLEQLEKAAAYVSKGPLPAEAVKRLHDVWARLGQM
jgi:aryl-alcohol dehydrogenase-like predicted oxidoreductase